MPANPIGVALRNRHAGQHKLVWANPKLQAPENFTLTSPAFENGASIPERYRGRIFAQNISPALAWTAPPAGAAELVLIIEDPDAPSSKPPLHGLVAGIDPSVREIPEGGLAKEGTAGNHGRGALGRRGWSGPMPPRSHGPHAYVFQLFVLDTVLDLPEKFTLAQALGAMTGHVTGRARLDGMYENS